MKNQFISTIIILFSLISFNSCQDTELNESIENLEPSIATSPSKTSTDYVVSAPIVWNNVHDKTISNLQITNPNGNCITLTNCSNITIENCKLGPSIGEGVSIEGSSNITVKYSSMESIRTGVYAVTSTGIKVEYNDVKNVLGPMPRGQMAQFDKVSGGGNSISYNTAENIAGESNPEDVINLWTSSGTASDPIRVIGNWIRGGGPSTSGGGIMVGDGGGSYILVENNILVNPGQYGIALAGGHDNIVRNNKIFSDKFTYNNIGLYAWNQYAPESYSNTAANNEVNYTNNEGNLNNWWNAGNMGTVTGWDTNKYNSELNASILPTDILGRHQSTASVPTPSTPTTVTTTEVNIYPYQVIKYLTITTTPKPEKGKISIYNSSGQLKKTVLIYNIITVVNVSRIGLGDFTVKVTDNGNLLKESKIKIVRR